MVSNAPPKAPPELRETWQRWTRVVTCCASRIRLGVTAQQYAQLYDELIEAIRLAAVSAETTERDFYEELKSLARPWLTLAALRQTDNVILSDLLRKCRDAGQRLQGAKLGWHWSGLMSSGALVLIVLLTIVTALTFSLDWWSRELTDRVEFQTNRVWQAWQGLGLMYQVGIVAAIVAPVALVLLRRLFHR